MSTFSQKDIEDSYRILQIGPNASLHDVKKAYIKAVKLHHPDRKGGNADAFVKIKHAYDLICDLFAKNDPYLGSDVRIGRRGNGAHQCTTDVGSLNARNSNASHVSSNSNKATIGEKWYRKESCDFLYSQDTDDMRGLFYTVQRPDAFEASNRSSSGSCQNIAQKQIIADLKVKLEEIYLGAAKKVRVKHYIPCPFCSKEPAKICMNCNGQGEVISLNQAGPRKIVQVSEMCKKCNGQGTIYDTTSCHVCSGTHKIKTKRTVPVRIDRGMRHRQTIIVDLNEISSDITTKTELLIRLSIRNHRRFRIRGHHLYAKKWITRDQAQNGCKVTIKHLDGRIIEADIPPGVALTENYKFEIPNEGMPLLHSEQTFGNMYIQFIVSDPDHK